MSALQQIREKLLRLDNENRGETTGDHTNTINFRERTAWIGRIHQNGNRPKDWLELIKHMQEDAQFTSDQIRQISVSNMFADAVKNISAADKKTEAYAVLMITFAQFRGQHNIEDAREIYQDVRYDARKHAVSHIAAAQFELDSGNRKKAMKILEKGQQFGAEPTELIQSAYSNLVYGRMQLVTDEEEKLIRDKYRNKENQVSGTGSEVDGSEARTFFENSYDGISSTQPIHSSSWKLSTQQQHSSKLIEAFSDSDTAPSLITTDTFNRNSTNVFKQRDQNIDTQNTNSENTKSPIKRYGSSSQLENSSSGYLFKVPGAGSVTSDDSNVETIREPHRTMRSYHSTPDCKHSSVLSSMSATKSSSKTTTPLCRRNLGSAIGKPMRVPVKRTSLPQVLEDKTESDESFRLDPLPERLSEQTQEANLTFHRERQGSDSGIVSNVGTTGNLTASLLDNTDLRTIDGITPLPKTNESLLNPKPSAGNNSTLSTGNNSTLSTSHTLVASTSSDTLQNNSRLTDTAQRVKEETNVSYSDSKPCDTKGDWERDRQGSSSGARKDKYLFVQHAESQNKLQTTDTLQNNSRLTDTAQRVKEETNVSYSDSKPCDTKGDWERDRQGSSSGARKDKDLFVQHAESQNKLQTTSTLTSTTIASRQLTTSAAHSAGTYPSLTTASSHQTQPTPTPQPPQTPAEQWQLMQQQQQLSSSGMSGFSQPGAMPMMPPQIPGTQAPMFNPMAMQPSNSGNVLVIKGKCYTVLGLTGRGGTSKVFTVFDNKQLLAVKCVDLSGADESTLESYKNEVELLQRLQYSNSVVKLYDSEYCEETNMLYLVMEKGDVDLSTYFKTRSKAGQLTALTLSFFWEQMLTAVQALHKEEIVHADLKPANFLLVAGHLKLIDFGIAKAVGDHTSVTRDQQVGTLNYMSPEAYLDTCGGTQVDDQHRVKPRIKIGVKSDVWSLGCILYNLVYGKTPFQHISNQFVKLQAITNPNIPIEFPPHPNQQLVNVLKSCLQRNPKQRPSIEELLSMSLHVERA